MKKYIIIPTYNEVKNLSKLIKEIFDLKILQLNIIIVDDNSPDGTGYLADKLAQEYPLTVIHRQGKLGLGSAYLTGFKKVFELGAEIIFEMDADFSHNPKDLPTMVAMINKGYDVVIGSRRIAGGNVKGWHWFRNLQSQAAMLFAKIVLGLKTKDLTAGYRCYRVSTLKQINLAKINSNGYAFQEEMIYLCEKFGFKIKEIPVTFIDRQFGKSKLGFKDIIEFFITILRLRFHTTYYKKYQDNENSRVQKN